MHCNQISFWGGKSPPKYLRFHDFLEIVLPLSLLISWLATVFIPAKLFTATILVVVVVVVLVV